MEKASNKIKKLFHDYGDRDYIGENVSQIEHMLQCAQLAYDEGQNKNVILASLLHDIGHLLSFENSSLEKDNFGTKEHEKIGANYLRNLGVSEEICSLVEKHVSAKKYLS